MALLLPNGFVNFQRDDVQTRAFYMLSRSGCSLNTVNNYRENVIHLCATNKCCRLIEMILRQYGTEKADSKNKFGWTPLMQALRERHLETAQLLINSGFHPSHRSYLGMSTLGIATAAGREAFECVFARYPAAINQTASDDISPLCIAASKDDRNLILRLLQLGVSVQTASEYTHFMMRHSTHEDIRKMAKPRLSTEDYWESNDDSIPVKPKVIDSQTEINNNECAKSTPEIKITPIEETNGFCFSTPKKGLPKARNPHHLTIKVKPLVSSQDRIFSPNLTYNKSSSYCMSPSVCFKLDSNDGQRKRKSQPDSVDGAGFTKRKTKNEDQLLFRFDNNNNQGDENCNPNSETRANKSETKTDCDPIPSTPQTLPMKKRTKTKPPKLINLKDKTHLNTSLGFTPDFKAVKSPNAPRSDDDEDAYGSKTPTPPRCSTPPTGIVLTSSQNQLVRLLQAHGLDCHIGTFIEQEVDFELFLTLKEVDLIDIGITNEAERKKLLKLI